MEREEEQEQAEVEREQVEPELGWMLEQPPAEAGWAPVMCSALARRHRLRHSRPIRRECRQHSVQELHAEKQIS